MVQGVFEDKVNIRTRIADSENHSEASGKIPRRKPVFPMSAERELARVALEVAVVIGKRIRPAIERVKAIYDVWSDENIRLDDSLNMDDGIGEILSECEEDILKDIDVTKLIRKVGRVGKIAQRSSVRDWKSLVDDAMGGEISEPFYMETMEDLMNKWVADSVSYISSLPQEALSKVHEIIIWGYTTHQPRINVYRRLENVVGMTRSHARQIATDQMGTLNCNMTEYEHKSLGVDKYKWTARHDSRVRPCHRFLNGKIISWNNPPEMWYETKNKGIVYTGRFCHAGEDFGCRCTAKPVFDVTTAQERLMKIKQWQSGDN